MMANSFFTEPAGMIGGTYAPARRQSQERGGSARARDYCCSGCDNFGQALRRLVAGKRGRIDPACIVELAVENRFALEPARGKTKDDEMAFDSAFFVTPDRFAVPFHRNRREGARGRLAPLAK